MFVLTVAAAEAAIGLAILVIFFRRRGSIAVDDVNRMKRLMVIQADRLPAAAGGDRRRARRPLIGNLAGQAGHHRRAVRRRGAELADLPRLPRRARSTAQVEPVARLDPVGRPAGRLGAARRRADRGDAGGGDHRLQPRPPLQLGLYGGGPEPAALLRLSVAVHLRDADAGDRRQPRPDVLRLGRGRPRLLPADRLLVPQAVGQCGGAEGVRRQPRRRFRLQRSASSAPSWCSAPSRSRRSSPPRRAWPDRPSASPACASTR